MDVYIYIYIYIYIYANSVLVILFLNDPELIFFFAQRSMVLSIFILYL